MSVQQNKNSTFLEPREIGELLSYNEASSPYVDNITPSAIINGAEGVADKLYDANGNFQDRFEVVDEGAFKILEAEEDTGLAVQYLRPEMFSNYEEQLSNLILLENQKNKIRDAGVPLVTDYSLHFTAKDDDKNTQLLPVLLGEYREITPYNQLDDEFRDELEPRFEENARKLHELKQKGEVHYLESTESFTETALRHGNVDNEVEEMCSDDLDQFKRNQAWDHEREEVVLTDIGDPHADTEQLEEALEKEGLLAERDKYLPKTQTTLPESERTAT